MLQREHQPHAFLRAVDQLFFIGDVVREQPEVAPQLQVAPDPPAG